MILSFFLQNQMSILFGKKVILFVLAKIRSYSFVQKIRPYLLARFTCTSFLTKNRCHSYRQKKKPGNIKYQVRSGLLQHRFLLIQLCPAVVKIHYILAWNSNKRGPAQFGAARTTQHIQTYVKRDQGNSSELGLENNVLGSSRFWAWVPGIWVLEFLEIFFLRIIFCGLHFLRRSTPILKCTIFVEFHRFQRSEKPKKKTKTTVILGHFFF